MDGNIVISILQTVIRKATAILGSSPGSWITWEDCSLRLNT